MSSVHLKQTFRSRGQVNDPIEYSDACPCRAEGDPRWRHGSDFLDMTEPIRAVPEINEPRSLFVALFRYLGHGICFARRHARMARLIVMLPPRARQRQQIPACLMMGLRSIVPP